MFKCNFVFSIQLFWDLIMIKQGFTVFIKNIRHYCIGDIMKYAENLDVPGTRHEAAKELIYIYYIVL